MATMLCGLSSKIWTCGQRLTECRPEIAHCDKLKGQSFIIMVINCEQFITESAQLYSKNILIPGCCKQAKGNT